VHPGPGILRDVTEADNRPQWTSDRRSYEVWFVTISDLPSAQGFWIRTTVTVPHRGGPYAGVWFARFDRADPGRNFGIHRRYDEGFGVGMGGLGMDAGFRVQAGDSVIRSGIAQGSLSGGGHEVSWDLGWPTGEPTYRLLPDWAYRGRAAPTKPYTPNVDTAATGWIEVDGERTALHGAPAQQGHLIGTRHAERWAWAHCSEFEGEDAVVQALTAQGRRGPLLTPFVTSVGVRWQGEWIRLTKLGRRRDFGLGTWRINVGNRRYRLTGRVEAPARALLRARYEDPDGQPRFCHNSEVASCRLALFERRAGGFEEVALLESRGATHAEWAGRTPAAAVERGFAEV
jgi:hypothetical protein